MLLQWFPDDVHITLKKDREMTSNFEILVDGTLIHSKHSGHGFLDESAEQQGRLRCAIVTAMST